MIRHILRRRTPPLTRREWLLTLAITLTQAALVLLAYSTETN